MGLLLRGLGNDAWEAIPASLKQIHAVLRRAEDHPDEVTRYHASAALAELDGIVRSYMNPGRKMPAGVFLPSDFSHHVR